MNHYQFRILMALQTKPVYGGTVSAEQAARNRKANRVARAQRRTNRRLDKSC